MSICPTCLSETVNPKFCNKSCAAKYNNTKYPKRQPEGSCAICRIAIITKRIYCDHCAPHPRVELGKLDLEDPVAHPAREALMLYCAICTKEYLPTNWKITPTCGQACAMKYRGQLLVENRIASWLSGEWDGSQINTGNLSITIRKYLLKANDYRCSKCGFNKRHPDDDSCILEINHINGNGMDHKPENLEVICPNCHALTSSYHGRNHGFGRPVFYHRNRA